jgi:hypothetical protein
LDHPFFIGVRGDLGFVGLFFKSKGSKRIGEGSTGF